MAFWCKNTIFDQIQQFWLISGNHSKFGGCKFQIMLVWVDSPQSLKQRFLSIMQILHFLPPTALFGKNAIFSNFHHQSRSIAVLPFFLSKFYLGCHYMNYSVFKSGFVMDNNRKMSFFPKIPIIGKNGQRQNPRESREYLFLIKMSIIIVSFIPN